MTSAPVIPLFHFPITRPLPMDYDESALPTDVIRAAQSGDNGAFNTIIRACKRRLLGMASRYVQSAAELDDLGQDIFVHILFEEFIKKRRGIIQNRLRNGALPPRPGDRSGERPALPPEP